MFAFDGSLHGAYMFTWKFYNVLQKYLGYIILQIIPFSKLYRFNISIGNRFTELQRWTSEWHNFLFSVESHFFLKCHNWWIRLWIRRSRGWRFAVYSPLLHSGLACSHISVGQWATTCCTQCSSFLLSFSYSIITLDYLFSRSITHCVCLINKLENV